MIHFGRRGGWVILASFIAGLMLTIMPIPEWGRVFRPEWVAMVLIYWCLAVPDRVGLGTGWSMGLMLDVVNGTVLGMHAMGLAAVAFLTLKLYQRIRMFPLWQQSLSVFIIVACNQILVLWVKGVIGQSPSSWSYWLPSVTSMVLWPLLFVILRELRRRFGVT